MAFGGLYQPSGGAVFGGRGYQTFKGKRFGGRPAVQRQETTTTVAPQAPSPEVMGLFTEAMKKYQPGGGFGKAEEAMLARAKKKYLASSAQRMVSAGLGGTSVPMAEETKFEEERGDPLRAGLEETRTSRLNELLMSKAGYLGGLGGRTSTTTSTQRTPFTPSGGGGVISGGAQYPTPAPSAPFVTNREKSRATQERLSFARASAGLPDPGARQIPEGGQILGNTYFPPSRFTRNVPELTL